MVLVVFGVNTLDPELVDPEIHPSLLLKIGSPVADYALLDDFQSRIGAWLLNSTDEDTFGVPASYYRENGLTTVFNRRAAKRISVPNYAVDLGGGLGTQPVADLGELFDDRSATRKGTFTFLVPEFSNVSL